MQFFQNVQNGEENEDKEEEKTKIFKENFLTRILGAAWGILFKFGMLPHLCGHCKFGAF